jgi:hypothetical protein
LTQILSVRFDKNSLPREINNWIDKSVDEGVVIPHYEQVEDENGSHYWRRYFSYNLLKEDLKVSN